MLGFWGLATRFSVNNAGGGATLGAGGPEAVGYLAYGRRSNTAQ